VVKDCARWNVGLTQTSVRVKETTRALECGKNLHSYHQRLRQRNGARWNAEKPTPAPASKKTARRPE
jgi:hypothetical protein